MFDRLMEHSSKGNTGKQGEPDIMFRFKDCAVMIEVKHGTEKQVKWNWRNHPCGNCSAVSDENSSDVKSYAENGAVHYLRHALDHGDLLEEKGVNIVLSVGVSFEDSGDFVAVPYYGNAETGEIFRFRPFHEAGYFANGSFDGNLDAVRETLDNGSLVSMGHDMTPFFRKARMKVEGREPFFMMLMWAMSNPDFNYVKLAECDNFDTIRDHCYNMMRKFTHSTYSDDLMKSFRPNGSNRRLVPDLKYAKLADYIDGTLKLTAYDMWYTAIRTFGLEDDYIRGRIISQKVAEYGRRNVIDIRSRYGIAATLIGRWRDADSTEPTVKAVVEDPLERLGTLSLMNLMGLRFQEEYPSMDLIPRGFTRRNIVADLVPDGSGLEEVSKAMGRCSKGEFGFFTVKRSFIKDGSPKAVEIRNRLNTKYTLRRLVGCKDFFLLVLENVPNDEDRPTQYFDGPATKPETILNKFDNTGVKFSNYKLKNGVWFRAPKR